MSMRVGPKGALDCIKAFSETDFTEDLRKFDIALIAHGDNDQIVPIGAAALLSSKLVQGSALRVYPGAPHGLVGSFQREFNADLLAFIRT
jgi:non-heme chloroperoxidase